MRRLALCFLLWCVAGSVGASESLLLELDGGWQQGGIVRGKAVPGSEVRFNGKNIAIGPKGEFVVGLGRDAEPTATLAIRYQGQSWENVYDIARRDYRIQRIEGVPQKTVTPSQEQRERARKEAEKVWLARQTEREATDFMQAFKWPLIGPITGVYGSQRVYNGEPRAPHYGVDIAAPTGTRVVAPAAGVVTLAEPDLFYSGGTLIIDHGHGLSSTFIHLSKLFVAVGDEVGQGDAIAEVGATGRATGPHLDWRMNWLDERVDPTVLVGPMPSAQ
ncbi:M23 family metallopeptidase [Gilvimarinus algae]|uniref:M23 family metallopeptidase n=1 Tax=Gilvimarinus algae TaxID=3058037 RepID=A0ABT8TDK7_9GAMM|nr:M23 family metallopeptidase [Gilvimarinus sp. SDUM040014]MDO3382172.1 M23 family metallopeptidase [Gilvimarinus sp. SDUM040014]